MLLLILFLLLIFRVAYKYWSLYHMCNNRHRHSCRPWYLFRHHNFRLRLMHLELYCKCFHQGNRNWHCRVEMKLRDRWGCYQYSNLYYYIHNQQIFLFLMICFELPINVSSKQTIKKEMMEPNVLKWLQPLLSQSFV